MPSGRNVSSVVTTPAPSTHAQVGPPTASVPACAITTSSNVPQPMSCTTLSTEGIHESTPPNRPRSTTIAGAPVRAPGIADSPTMALPIRVPTTVATSAAEMVSGGAPAGCRTARTPAKPSRLTPRFAQKAPWSSSPSDRGTGPSRVGATSSAPRGRSVVVPDPDEVDDVVDGMLRLRFPAPA